MHPIIRWPAADGDTAPPATIPITPPRIARLTAVSRIEAWRRVKAGRYGKAVRGRAGALCVDLAAVERASGITFSRAQLLAVGINPGGDHAA